MGRYSSGALRDRQLWRVYFDVHQPYLRLEDLRVNSLSSQQWFYRGWKFSEPFNNCKKIKLLFRETDKIIASPHAITFLEEMCTSNSNSNYYLFWHEIYLSVQVYIILKYHISRIIENYCLQNNFLNITGKSCSYGKKWMQQ